MVNWAMLISDCSLGQHSLNAFLIVAREISVYCAWKKRAPPCGVRSRVELACDFVGAWFESLSCFMKYGGDVF